MAKLRKFCAYRRLDARPYTRRSRYGQKDYVKASPVSKVVRYRMGNLTKTFPLKVTLRSRGALQIRHNAIESARQTSNKLLEKELGNNFHFSVRMYPHHVLRENALASGAGADRLSTGMSHAFGKVIGIAARIKEGQALFTVEVEKDKLDVAKRALHRASFKVPCKTFVTVDSL